MQNDKQFNHILTHKSCVKMNKYKLNHKEKPITGFSCSSLYQLICHLEYTTFRIRFPGLILV